MENNPFEDVFPIEHGDFPASYVSLPEGNWDDPPSFGTPLSSSEKPGGLWFGGRFGDSPLYLPGDDGWIHATSGNGIFYRPTWDNVHFI